MEQESKVDYTNDQWAYIHKVGALALIPAIDIPGIRVHLSDRLSLEDRIVLRTFDDYYESFWERRMGFENLSVFGLKEKTNDASEALNSKVKRDIGVLLPPIMFTGKNILIFNPKNIP